MIAGITNYEEYSLTQEGVEEKKEEHTGTLKKDRTLLRDEKKMEKLKAKLHTDDERELYIYIYMDMENRRCDACWDMKIELKPISYDKSDVNMLFLFRSLFCNSKAILLHLLC